MAIRLALISFVAISRTTGKAEGLQEAGTERPVEGPPLPSNLLGNWDGPG